MKSITRAPHTSVRVGAITNFPTVPGSMGFQKWPAFCGKSTCSRANPLWGMEFVGHGVPGDSWICSRRWITPQSRFLMSTGHRSRSTAFHEWNQKIDASFPGAYNRQHLNPWKYNHYIPIHRNHRNRLPNFNKINFPNQPTIWYILYFRNIN